MSWNHLPQQLMHVLESLSDSTPSQLMGVLDSSCSWVSWTPSPMGVLDSVSWTRRAAIGERVCLTIDALFDGWDK
jgi:hypothetical protein